MKKGTALPPDAPSVLVVEDERIVAGDIESRLTFLGYRVVSIAPSGAEAIQAAERTWCSWTSTSKGTWTGPRPRP
jgi:hypothetical protein